MQKKELKKQINFLNGKLVFAPQQKIDNIDLINSIPAKFKEKYLDINDNDFEITFDNNEKIRISYFAIKNSGDENNYNKRIQVPKGQFVCDETNVFAVYFSGEKNCYARLSSNKPIINHNDTNKSVWFNFHSIYCCLKFGINIIDFATDKIYGEKYRIYYSTNFEHLIYFNKHKFNHLDPEILKQIKNIFDVFSEQQKNLTNENKTNNDNYSYIKNLENFEKNEINNQNNDVISAKKTMHNINFSAFNIKQESNEYRDYYNTSPNKNVGRKAEEIFNKWVLSKTNFIKKKLNIEKIFSVHWINEKKETYSQYDFLINDYIYIDVKGTTSDKNSFVISQHENDFRKEITGKGNQYFIVNICNILNDVTDKDFTFYDQYQLEELNFKKQIKYLYQEDKNE